MRLRPILSLAAAAALAVVPAPAHAVNVTVGFGISVGTHLPTGQFCPVDVPAGANGLAVMDAAVAAGCIESYETEVYPFGAYVRCINRVCAAPPEALFLTYWHMYENGVSTSYGVSDFVASSGDQLVFAYTTWLVPIA